MFSSNFSVKIKDSYMLKIKIIIPLILVLKIKGSSVKDKNVYFPRILV